jgi:site-specific DNA recombinase
MRKASPRHHTNGTVGIRCAIYTRKSSEEGLEQAFNSLDAQRETCESYILSQKHEGWVALPQMYDDGGISGGTLDRPGLKRLLADIAAGMVDTVVVYKVDRLTRSLSDFAKIVEAFEANGVTFVSVTQSFNTTTSMGRLTLNMLLSFAQFEREVAGERIRDKIAASKQKGMWMGGLPPLGYDVIDRKLVINQNEAETVRHIFRRYADLGSVRALQEELDSAGILSKRRVDRFGREAGGKPLGRGALYLMLQNRIYRGEIVHKQASYPGQHQAIVEAELWETVQKILVENRVDRSTSARAAAPSLLAGLVHDDAGERMSPTHANKKGRRYRYYVSQSLIRRGRPNGSDIGRRVPAGDLENLIEDRIILFLSDPPAIYSAIEYLAEDANLRQAMVQKSADLARGWADREPSARRSILQLLVERIDVQRERIDVAIRPGAIPVIIVSESGPRQPHADPDDMPFVMLSIPARLRRTGKEMRLVIEGFTGGPQRSPDRSLLRLLADAHRFQKMVMQQQGRSITDLAREAGIGRSYFTRILRLNFLAPEIVTAILDGRQPSQLTAKHLTRNSRLANDWPSQAAQRGIT